MSSDQLLRFCPCLRPPSTVSSSGCYAWVTWPKHTIFRRLIVARGHSCWSTTLFNLALNIMIGFAHPVRGVEELSFVVKRLHPFYASTRNVQVSHPYRRIDMTSDLWNDFVWKMLLLFRILSSLTIAAVTVAIRVWISSARFEYIVWRRLSREVEVTHWPARWYMKTTNFTTLLSAVMIQSIQDIGCRSFRKFVSLDNEPTSGLHSGIYVWIYFHSLIRDWFLATRQRRLKISVFLPQYGLISLVGWAPSSRSIWFSDATCLPSFLLRFKVVQVQKKIHTYI